MPRAGSPKEMSAKQRAKLGVRADARVNPVQAIALKKAGLTYAQIGKALTPDGEKPITAQAIHKCVKKHLNSVGDVDQKILDPGYSAELQKDMKVQLIQEKHIHSLQAITPSKLSDESAKDNAMTAKLLHEQLRLENNESTQNVAHSFAQMVEDLSKGEGL
jgi:hypothetical protein